MSKERFERVHYIGVDLGKLQDYTAIVMLVRTRYYHASLDRIIETTEVRLIERFPLGTLYTDVVDRVWTMFENVSIKRTGILVIDATGVGEPVREMFIKEGLYPVGVYITGGNTVTYRNNSCWSVPRNDLMSTLRITFESQNIKFAAGMPLTATLIDELKNLQAERKSAKTRTEEDELWREKKHDDITFALALCCWYAARHFPTVPEVYDMDRPWEKDEEFARNYDPLGRK